MRNNSRFTSFLVLLPILLGSSASLAQDRPTVFGPELTFAFDGESVKPEKLKEFLDHLERHLVKSQPEGAKFKYHDLHRKFISPNGWFFRVSHDPGVLEVTMSPLTTDEIRRFKDDIQDAIFVSAANVGLFPWDYLGGGHINMDISAFGGDLLLARNFIVDFWNHNELSMGILNYDLINAFPMPMFDKDTRDKVHDLLDNVLNGERTNDAEGIWILFQELHVALNGGLRMSGLPVGKMRDVNFQEKRIEIRSVRPQANAEVWYNQTLLIERRIDYLRRFKELIPLKPRVLIRKKIDRMDEELRLIPPVLPREAISSFYDYVTESGLDWKDHRGYIWPDWFRGGELEKFEASAEFKEKESQYALRRKTCQSDLL